MILGNVGLFGATVNQPTEIKTKDGGTSIAGNLGLFRGCLKPADNNEREIHDGVIHPNWGTKQPAQETFEGETEILLDYYEQAMAPYKDAREKGIHVTTIFDTDAEEAQKLIEVQKRLKELGAI